MGSRIATNVRWFSDRRRKGKRTAGFTIIAIRCAELERLFAARYGGALPDDDAGRDDALVMAHHLAHRLGDPRQRIAAWLELWTPWMISADVDAVITNVMSNPLRWRADKLAVRLGLTDAERRRLHITTIGSIDRTKTERAKDRRERGRLRKQHRRRAKGAKPRTEYDATSVSRTKPWVVLGMSRAKWYRTGRPEPPPTRETGADAA